MKEKIIQYLLITVSTIMITCGIYFFRFPNNFSFGGVTGLAVILAGHIPYSASFITNVINISLLGIGFIFLGKGFGVRTVYVTILMSVLFALLDRFCPITKPLTNQPLLELVYAVAIPASGMAMLFNIGASSGGTDIIAMIVQKYTQRNIGTTLLTVDFFIVVLVCTTFDITTGLYSLLGLLTKSFIIDGVIEGINRKKYFNIICDNPEPICKFITEKLHRGATLCNAEGAYLHSKKCVIFTVMGRGQAIQLRNFVKQVEPNAFMLISDTSQIIGKGFNYHI